ncbi:MAG TPA: hypothetical protein VGP93_09540, partial [Polyangiaceae bacterium]|nr:hypothetical protein [Polyangiaceae bacterium]
MRAALASTSAFIFAALTLACGANSPNEAPATTSSAGSAAGGSSGSGAAGHSGGGSPSAGGTSGSSSGGMANAGAGTGGGSAGSSGSTGAGGGTVISCPGGTPGGAGGNTDSPLGLTPGTWMDITPEAVDLNGTFGANSIDLDPSNPLTLYASIDQRGIWKTTDGGANWVRLGDPNQMGNDASKYIDSPLRVAVDPCDPLHLYATQGVRGSTQGFWVSEDGGENWARPAGFIEIAKTATNDVTTLAIDPSNFAHILVGSHSPWSGMGNAGVLESKDAGQTWVAHPPGSTFPVGSVALGFLYDPAAGVGDSNTWFLNGDGGGILRTTDAGGSWNKVSDAGG